MKGGVKGGVKRGVKGGEKGGEGRGEEGRREGLMGGESQTFGEGEAALIFSRMRRRVFGFTSPSLKKR